MRSKIRGQRSNSGAAIAAALWLLVGATMGAVYALGYVRGEIAAMESEVAK